MFHRKQLLIMQLKLEKSVLVAHITFTLLYIMISKSQLPKLTRDIYRLWSDVGKSVHGRRFYSPVYNDYISYKLSNLKRLLSYKNCKSTYAILMPFLLKYIKIHYPKDQYNNRYRRAERIVISVCHRFNELLVDSLIDNNDYFVFPTPGFGYLCVMPHYPPKKNYVNFATDHKRVNLKFIPGRTGIRYVKQPYIHYVRQSDSVRIMKKVVNEHFKYTYNGPNKLQISKSK